MSPKEVAQRAAVVTLSLLAFAGCERYALDRRMEELCKKDGGVHVYETVQLTPDMFDAAGNPFPPILRSVVSHSANENKTARDELLASRYIRRLEEISIIKGDPVKGVGIVIRISEKVIRLSDGKLLGEAILYGRSGGDLIAFPHFSSKQCPVGQVSNAITRAVFISMGK